MISVFNTILILILASFPLIYFNYDGFYSNKCSSQWKNLKNAIDGMTAGQCASMKIPGWTEKLHLACAETVDCFEKNAGEESDPLHQEWSKLSVQVQEICDSLRYMTEQYFKCISKSHSNSSTFQNRNTYDNCELADLEYGAPRGFSEKRYVQE